MVVGLANHTLLIAKDRTERRIDDSAAPIRNDKGEVARVVLIYRDANRTAGPVISPILAQRLLAILRHLELCVLTATNGIEVKARGKSSSCRRG
jgi:hypothetical protein